jgi:hypothetical protein
VQCGCHSPECAEEKNFVGAKLSEKRARKDIRAEKKWLEVRKVSCSRWSEDNLADKIADLVLRRSQSAETVVARPSERGPESVPAGSHRKWYRKCGGPRLKW